MKDLYGKVIPEIAKFEDKLITFQFDVDSHKTIIRQFDEILMQKSDKMAMVEFRNFLENNYATKMDNEKRMDDKLRDYEHLKGESSKKFQKE